MTIEIEEHRSANPQYSETKVFRIPSDYNLETLDSSIFNFIDTRTLSFFENWKEQLTELSNSVSSVAAKTLISKLLKLDFKLVVVERGKSILNIDPDKGGAFISFEDPDKESSNWVIDFESRMYNPSHYPEELLELMKFACFRFSYYMDGAQLWPLGYQNLATHDYGFDLFMSEYGNINFPVDQLRIMYLDYSGSHIYYDNNHEIWYGGAEEEGIFKVHFSLSEIIDSIFITHMKEEFPDLYTIISGKYLPSSKKPTLC